MGRNPQTGEPVPIAAANVPAFKAGNYPGGIRNGIKTIHEVIGGDYGSLRTGGNGHALQDLVILAVLLGVFVLGASSTSRSRRRHRGRSGLPWMIGPTFGGGRSRSGGYGKTPRSFLAVATRSMRPCSGASAPAPLTWRSAG